MSGMWLVVAAETAGGEPRVFLWHTFFFLFFAALACAFSVTVLLSANIVRMAFYLIVALGATSGLFFLAGAEFVAGMQLLIYVGGTLVLLIFGVMLTAKSQFISMRTPAGEWVIAAIVGGSLLALLASAAVNIEPAKTDADQAAASEHAHTRTVEPTATRIGMALIGARVDRLDPTTDPELAGGMAGYLLPFEIVSLHLLVVLLGAAYLARAKRRMRQVPGNE
jgi:NADH-quinone oxidoreductase subunit J